MAIESAGEFNFNVITSTWSRDSNGVSAAINLEGDATGYGNVTGTLTFTGTPGTNSGTVTWLGADSAAEMTFSSGHGVFNQTDAGKWRVRSFTVDSNGVVLIGDGVLDSEARTFSGSLSSFT